MKWFELPTNHTAVISDAVPWVADMAKARPETYDYIVHDVFTGGVEPTALFTLEFLEGLYKLLKEDGSIAIVGYHSPRWNKAKKSRITLGI
jgi:spermidine synthase